MQKQRLFAAGFWFVLLSGLAKAPLAWKPNNVPTNSSSSLNFIAIGDWGGVGSLPGDIHVQQKKVASGMAHVAGQRELQCVVSLGDNFYYRGVSGKSASSRIVQTYERVYSHDALVGIPWYVIAGNHDYYGNVTKQIEYTYVSRNKSQTDPDFFHRWEFPSLYHKKTLRQGDVTVDLILIDTVDLEACFSSNNRFNLLRHLVNLPMRLRGHNCFDTDGQWKWIQESLEQSTADYVVVGGHFPVFSQGIHGPTESLVQNLKPLLEKHGAHYISGHEHSMMHFRQQSSNVSSVGGVNYIVTGTGNTCCGARRSAHRNRHTVEHSDNPLLWHLFQQDKRKKHNLGHVKGGFVSFQATASSMVVQFHDQNGEVLHEIDPISPLQRHGKKFPIYKFASSSGESSVASSR